MVKNSRLIRKLKLQLYREVPDILGSGIAIGIISIPLIQNFKSAYKYFLVDMPELIFIKLCIFQICAYSNNTLVFIHQIRGKIKYFGGRKSYITN
ncbi:MAG: hypothetical protein WC578_03390 [Candidatus Omnitrophota bacterium]|jgi:hypothetical protein